MIKASKK